MKKKVPIIFYIIEESYIFASSAHVGAFLRCLYTYQIHKLPISGLSGTSLWIWVAPYTNRLFRMLSCTKKSDPTRYFVGKDILVVLTRGENVKYNL